MKSIFLLLVTASLITGCKKEVKELPAITQTGENTFGAKVDGSFFVPKGFGPFPANDILEARFGIDRDLYISATNLASSPNEKEMHLFLKNVRTPGVYLLNTNASHPSNGANYAYYVKRNLTPENEWITSATYTGSVTITRIDTVNRIASGTFEFTAINMYNSPQPLSVTEGRFDVKVQ